MIAMFYFKQLSWDWEPIEPWDPHLLKGIFKVIWWWSGTRCTIFWLPGYPRNNNFEQRQNMWRFSSVFVLFLSGYLAAWKLHPQPRGIVVVLAGWGWSSVSSRTALSPHIHGFSTKWPRGPLTTAVWRSIQSVGLDLMELIHVVSVGGLGRLPVAGVLSGICDRNNTGRGIVIECWL